MYKESYFTKGELKIDESYFGARRIKGVRDRRVLKTKREEIKYIYR